MENLKDFKILLTNLKEKDNLFSKRYKINYLEFRIKQLD